MTPSFTARFSAVTIHRASAKMWLAIAVMAGIGCAAADTLRAQDFPVRTVKILNNSGAGGTFDIFARALASELQKRWRQAVIVEPRPGGNFMIAGRACAEAPPDGHTLCLLSGETLVYSEFLYKSVPYDPRKDFAPVTNLFFNTQVLVASAALGVKTLDDLFVVAKSKPLAFSAPAVAQRLFLERLIRAKGVDIVAVPFRGGSDAVAALLNGTTPILMAGGANFAPLIRDGKIVGLAVDGSQRSPLFPQVPTLSDLGHQEKLNRNYAGLVVPAATPPALVARLHGAVTAIMTEPAFRQQHFLDRALEPIGDTHEEFARFLDNDRKMFEHVVTEAKIERQ